MALVQGANGARFDMNITDRVQRRIDAGELTVVPEPKRAPAPDNTDNADEAGTEVPVKKAPAKRPAKRASKKG